MILYQQMEILLLLCDAAVSERPFCFSHTFHHLCHQVRIGGSNLPQLIDNVSEIFVASILAQRPQSYE